ERAAEIDPRLAVAHTGLADCHNVVAYYGTEAPKSVYPKARSAVERAIELDPSLPEAHALLAEVTYLYDWQWNAAEVEFCRAIELGPNCVVAYQLYGVFLSLLGRASEALAALHAAERLDPLSVLIGTQIGLCLYEARRYAEAAQQLSRTLELDASLPLAHTCLGMTYVQQSLYEDAAGEVRVAAEIAPAGLTPKAPPGEVCAVTGKRSDAQKILRGLKSEAKRRHVSAAYAAVVHLGLGDVPQALDLAELARRERSGFLTRVKVDPLLDGLRSEARFAK